MFNKKYATGAHFLLKLVAGVGFSDLGSFALLTAILPSGSRRRLNHLLRWFKSNTTHIFNKKHPQGMSFVKSWLRGMDLNH